MEILEIIHVRDSNTLNTEKIKEICTLENLYQLHFLERTCYEVLEFQMLSDLLKDDALKQLFICIFDNFKLIIYPSLLNNVM